MRGPLVSVVVPVFNGEAFLGEALESVFAQNYEPLEVIVVNDGSTDRSGEIAKSDARIRYLEQPNRGASSARNLGVAVASGTFIGFVDADDVIPPTKFSDQIGYLLEHPEIDCVLGRQDWIEEPEGLARDVVWGDPDGIPLMSMVLRSNVLREIGGYVEEHGGDMDMLVRLRASGHGIAVLPQMVLHRRYHGNNLVAGRALAPIPPISLKLKLDAERARRASGA